VLRLALALIGAIALAGGLAVGRLTRLATVGSGGDKRRWRRADGRSRRQLGVDQRFEPLDLLDQAGRQLTRIRPIDLGSDVLEDLLGPLGVSTCERGSGIAQLGAEEISSGRTGIPVEDRPDGFPDH
jgi:hypothetical protein